MGTARKPTVKPGLDGRRAWRDRNRDAVLDALLDFYEEGNGSPGAEAIAERSGVSRRSLFRYFDDLDELCRAAIARHADRIGHLFEVEGLGEGDLAGRIDRLVAQRVKLFEAIAAVRRIARQQAPTQPILAAEMARSSEVMRRQVERQFELELAKLSADERPAVLAAADVMVSFEAFDLLRGSRGLSLARVTEAMRRGLEALFC